MMGCNDLVKLRGILSLPGGCCALSQTELAALLDRCGSVEAAAYEGCIRLSQNSEVKLPAGMNTPDQSDYWLNLSKVYRPNGARNLSRSDERT